MTGVELLSLRPTLGSGDAANNRNFADVVCSPYWHNVKNFGATGNGSTDDTANIRRAMGACYQTGGTLYFPAGTYITSDTIWVSPNGQAPIGAGKPNIRILGDGGQQAAADNRGSIIQGSVATNSFSITASISGNVMTVTATSGTLVVGLFVSGGSTLDGTWITETHTENAARTGTGGTGTYTISISQANSPTTATDKMSGWLLQACQQPGSGNLPCAEINGLVWSNGSSTGNGLCVSGGTITPLAVRNCSVYLTGGSSGIGISGSSRPTGAADTLSIGVRGLTLIENCRVGGSANMIAIDSATGSVINCDINGTNIGIMSCAAGTAIHGCRMETCAQGIVLGLDAFWTNFTSACSGFSIIGCEFESNSSSGIYLYNAQEGIVAGNAVTANLPCSHALRIRDCNYTLFAGNGLSGQYTVACVKIINDTTGNVFIGNAIGITGGAGGVAYSVPAITNGDKGIHVWPLVNQQINGIEANITTRTFAFLPGGANGGTAIKGMEYYITNGATNPVGNFWASQTDGGGGGFFCRVCYDGSVWRIC